MTHSQIRVLKLLRKTKWLVNEQIAQQYYPDYRRASNNTIATILAELKNMGCVESRTISGVKYYEYRKTITPSEFKNLIESSKA